MDNQIDDQPQEPDSEAQGIRDAQDAMDVEQSRENIVPWEVYTNLRDECRRLMDHNADLEAWTKERVEVRRRVNVSTSVKGIQTTDATIEITSTLSPHDEAEFRRSAIDFHSWKNANWPPPVEVSAPPKPDKPAKDAAEKLAAGAVEAVS